MSNKYTDTPITDVNDDELGVYGFAQRFAERIGTLFTSLNENGMTFGICGSWGSGKTSIINLIRSEIEEENKNTPKKEKINITEISFLWVQNQEAIIDRLCKKMDFVFVGWYKYVFYVLGLALTFGLIFWTAYILFSVGWGELFKNETNVQELKLGGALATIFLIFKYGLCCLGKCNDLLNVWSAGRSAAKAKEAEREGKFEVFIEKLRKISLKREKRHLIIFDDLDRLPPDEVFFVLRAVKMLSDLPHTIFLLSYDEAIVKKVLAEKFTAEDSDYIDKIVQIPQSIPIPDKTVLKNFLSVRAGDALNLNGEMEIGFDVTQLIAPLIRTPRDIVKIGNILSLYSEVSEERKQDNQDELLQNLHPEDLLIMTVLKVTWSELYEAIHNNRLLLVGSADWSVMDMGINQLSGQNQLPDIVKRLGFEGDENAEKIILRLFPIFVDGNDDSIHKEANRDYRIQSRTYFPSYFSFELPARALPYRVIEKIKSDCEHTPVIYKYLEEEVTKSMDARDDYFDLIMDELSEHSSEFSHTQISNLLMAVFKLGDTIIKFYEERGEDWHGAYIKIISLVNACVLYPMSNDKRDKILMEAINYSRHPAPLWHLIFNNLAHAEHFPAGDNQAQHKNNCYLTEESAVALFANAIEDIKADKSKFIKFDSVLNRLMLLIWSQNDKANEEIKDWISSKLNDDHFIALLAKSFSVLCSSSSADGKEEWIDAQHPEEWVDVDKFLERVKGLAFNGMNALSNDEVEVLSDYQYAIDNPHIDKDFLFPSNQIPS